MANILITGPAGSGKSHLSAYLRSIGVEAFDTDTIHGLAGWVNKNTGKSVIFPNEAGSSWFGENKYMWSREVLKTFLDEHPNAILLGVSDDDASEFKIFFDKIFYLNVSSKMLESRLSKREAPMGKTLEQRTEILRSYEAFKKKAMHNGLILVDAERPPDVIWKEILKSIET